MRERGVFKLLYIIFTIVYYAKYARAFTFFWNIDNTIGFCPLLEQDTQERNLYTNNNNNKNN